MRVFAVFFCRVLNFHFLARIVLIVFCTTAALRRKNFTTELLAFLLQSYLAEIPLLNGPSRSRRETHILACLTGAPSFTSAQL